MHTQANEDANYGLFNFHPLCSPSQMSKSRISSLESQVETLAQSLSRLWEQIFALEEEKQLEQCDTSSGTPHTPLQTQHP